MKRPCLDCGTLTTASRCPTHTSAKNKARGSSTQRGYGKDHRNARKQLALTLPAPCAYGCGKILYPLHPWVAAHRVDGDDTQGWIASCPTCNERAKTR